MIKVNELKIGNWVDSKLFGRSKITGVLSGSQVSVVYFDKFGESHNAAHLLEPIPLTPGMLERCGFLYSEHDELWAAKNDFLIRIVHGKIFLFNYKRNHCEIQFLHQLQNLYFALTGEELEVGSNGI